MKSLLLFVWVAFLLVYEAVRPATPVPANNNQRRMRNIVLGVTGLGVSLLMVWLLSLFVAAMPPLVTAPVIVQLIALDLWAYALHRAYHRIPLLWRFHAPHHLDEHLDVTSTFRFHAGEIAISYVLRVIPMLMLGIALQTVVIFEILLVLAAAFHHSNVRLPQPLERALSWVIVTPSIHWVHHHNVRADTDSNYAAILSLWDILFGSRSPAVRTVGMPMGVEGERDMTFWRLLAYPFVR